MREKVISLGRDGVQPRATRLLSIDSLRGLIIVLMALDHANYFIANKHSSGEYWGGPFPEYGDPVAFLTRFVTHFCAPGFFFLMGTGMSLFAESRRKKGWSEWMIIRHFLVRGGFLIALQLLLINRIWELGPLPFPTIYIGVLVALGGTMILGSFLLNLRPAYLILLSIGLFIGTEFIHPGPDMWGRISIDPPNLVLVRPGGDGSLWSNYPIIPWLELVTFGIVFGKWVRQDPANAYRRSLIMGLIFLLVFAIIRYLNGFGNIRPRMGSGWIDFLNVVKYPPSMTFTLLTMGFNLSLLWVFSRAGRFFRWFLGTLVVFGSAPMFVYITHLIVYMVLGRLVAPNGMSIPAMIPFWVLGVLILYPPTLWYGRLKANSPSRSVLHLL